MPNVDTMYVDTDGMIRAATRNAPASIKRKLDRERRSQGLPAIWAVEHRAAKRAVPDTMVLVGPCCPGRSSPVTVASDGLHIPEQVSPNAFDHSLRLIKARAVNIELQAGHGGEAIASTADGSLDFTTSPDTGLMLVARVPVSRLNSEMLAAAIRGTMGLSVSMLPRRMTIERVGGRRLRVLRELELKAVAALWRPADHGRACYPSARAFCAFACDGAAVRRAMRHAAIHASTATFRAGWQ